jgi:hypothetical protein
VVELRAGKYIPEHAGKLQFYVALVDDRLRRPTRADRWHPDLRQPRRSDRPVRAQPRRIAHGSFHLHLRRALPAEERVALPGPDDLTIQAPPTDGSTPRHECTLGGVVSNGTYWDSRTWDLARSAYIADLDTDPDAPDAFVGWLQRALIDHASLSPKQRVALVRYVRAGDAVADNPLGRGCGYGVCGCLLSSP